MSRPAAGERRGGMVVFDLCADPLCGNVATHTMISRVPGHRTKVCGDHLARVRAAAKKAGLDDGLLDIRPMKQGER